MEIPWINDFLARRARTRLRHAMRGYRRLKATNSLGRIAAVKEALTNTPACQLAKGSCWLLGLKSENAELSIRQFLLVRRVTTGLGEALLQSVGSYDEPVRYALPMKWREVLSAHGFPVARSASEWLWVGFIGLYLANGIFTVCKLAVANALETVRGRAKPLGRYVFFDTLSTGNLPSSINSGETHDVINWYLRWSQCVPRIDTVCHSVTSVEPRLAAATLVIAIPSPLLPLGNPYALTKFLLRGVASCVTAVFGILRGIWWPALMLGEAAKAAQVRFQKPEWLARDYMFHNSNWIYRPLWTYEAERKGSQIKFYFYSTNCEKFKQVDTHPSLAYGWQSMTWSQYLVWDEFQASFVRRAVGAAAKIDVVRSIPFNAGTPAPQNIPSNSIAVFDVQPMRDAIYQPLAIDQEYYVPRNANKFLDDICEASRAAGLIFILKRKRDVGSRLHPAYARATELLLHNGQCIEIDPATSAHALIERCQAVVSAPFTSTALIGRELGKPSIYYDPYGICAKDDRAAHGIPILTGNKELQDWLSELSKKILLEH